MVKISALPSDSAPTSTDYIIVNDVETGATKKVLLSDLSQLIVGDYFWQEIGRTTLGVAGDTLSVTGLPTKKYLLVLVSSIASTAVQTTLRFNNDSGSNYAFQYQNNGGSSNVTSTTGIGNISLSSSDYFGRFEIRNIANKVKLVLVRGMTGTTSAGTAPTYDNFQAKWVNTTDAINRIDLINIGAGDFAIGTEMVVLGHD